MGFSEATGESLLLAREWRDLTPGRCRNIGGTQLGTFSGLFVANRPFCSRDFPFRSLCRLPEVMSTVHNCLKNLERAKGIEPSTYSLGSCRSTTELRPQTRFSGF